jgi:hypothetical protein
VPEKSLLEPPVVRVNLQRHQALIFDVALWHRNPSSAERTQWSVTYMADPKGVDEFNTTVKFMGDFFGKHPRYDVQRFPFFPADWLDNSSDSDLARHLNDSGVMKEFVERFGEFL